MVVWFSSLNIIFEEYCMELLGIVMDSISDAVSQHRRCGGRWDNTNKRSI